MDERETAAWVGREVRLVKLPAPDHPSRAAQDLVLGEVGFINRLRTDGLVEVDFIGGAVFLDLEHVALVRE